MNKWETCKLSLNAFCLCLYLYLAFRSTPSVASFGFFFPIGHLNLPSQNYFIGGLLEFEVVFFETNWLIGTKDARIFFKQSLLLLNYWRHRQWGFQSNSQRGRRAWFLGSCWLLNLFMECGHFLFTWKKLFKTRNTFKNNNANVWDISSLLNSSVFLLLFSKICSLKKQIVTAFFRSWLCKSFHIYKFLWNRSMFNKEVSLMCE